LKESQNKSKECKRDHECTSKQFCDRTGSCKDGALLGQVCNEMWGPRCAKGLYCEGENVAADGNGICSEMTNKDASKKEFSVKSSEESSEESSASEESSEEASHVIQKPICKDEHDHCKELAHECGPWFMYKECPATCCPNCDCSIYENK